MTDLHSGRSKYEVRPVEGESHEGRQWGYVVVDTTTEITAISATTGGTGECWNIGSGPDPDPEADAVHVCDLDEFIAALTALRDSEAHRLHVERWS